LHEIAVITTNFFDELIPSIRNGTVAGTIYQRPFTQGRMAVQALYDFLELLSRNPAHVAHSLTDSVESEETVESV